MPGTEGGRSSRCAPSASSGTPWCRWARERRPPSRLPPLPARRPRGALLPRRAPRLRLHRRRAGGRGRRDCAVIDQFVRWPAPPSAARAPAQPDRDRRGHARRPAPRRRRARAPRRLTRGSTAPCATDRLAPAGWSLDGVALEPFRDRPTPTLRFRPGARSLRVQLLPGGSDPAASSAPPASTCSTTTTNEPPATRATTPPSRPWSAGLTTLPRGAQRRRTATAATPRAPFSTPPRLTPPDPELRWLIEAALAQAMQRGGFRPSSAGRSARRPSRLPRRRGAHDPPAHGDRKQRLWLPPRAPSRGFFRTARFDVLYDDDEKGSASPRTTPPSRPWSPGSARPSRRRVVAPQAPAPPCHRGARAPRPTRPRWGRARRGARRATSSPSSRATRSRAWRRARSASARCRWSRCGRASGGSSSSSCRRA